MLTASLSVSHTHILLSTCISDIHYSCSVYLISSIISCQISAPRRYCSVSAFSEMYSLLLSVQILNVPKMTCRFNLGWFLLCFMPLFLEFHFFNDHVYANMEYKLRFSFYILKKPAETMFSIKSVLLCFSYHSKEDCLEKWYSSHFIVVTLHYLYYKGCGKHRLYKWENSHTHSFTDSTLFTFRMWWWHHGHYHTVCLFVFNKNWHLFIAWKLTLASAVSRLHQ